MKPGFRKEAEEENERNGKKISSYLRMPIPLDPFIIDRKLHGLAECGCGAI